MIVSQNNAFFPCCVASFKHGWQHDLVQAAARKDQLIEAAFIDIGNDKAALIPLIHKAFR
jgi:hypothetical protein